MLSVLFGLDATSELLEGRCPLSREMSLELPVLVLILLCCLIYLRYFGVMELELGSRLLETDDLLLSTCMFYYSVLDVYIVGK